MAQSGQFNTILRGTRGNVPVYRGVRLGVANGVRGVPLPHLFLRSYRAMPRSFNPTQSVAAVQPLGSTQPLPARHVPSVSRTSPPLSPATPPLGPATPPSTVSSPPLTPLSPCGPTFVRPLSLFSVTEAASRPSVPVRAFSSRHQPETVNVGDMRMRVNDTLPRIEEDIGSLLEEELEGVEGDRERFEALKTSVTSSGFEIIEEENRVTMVRDVEGRTVSMSWDPTIQPMAPVNDTPEVAELDSEIKEFQNIAAALRKDQEEGTISSQVADDGDELDSEQDEEVDNERVAADLEVEVRVVQNSRVLVAQCAVAEDGLLYIYRLTDGDGEKYVFLFGRNRVIDLEYVSRDLQHRLYDYFDSLGVGDSAAAFVQKYNEQFHQAKSTEALHFLEQYFDVESKRAVRLAESLDLNSK